jgi:hypothetical protein
MRVDRDAGGHAMIDVLADRADSARAVGVVQSLSPLSWQLGNKIGQRGVEAVIHDFNGAVGRSAFPAIGRDIAA